MKAHFSTVTDPVCGTKVVTDGSLTVTFHSVQHHFCSAQCQERFEESPEFFASPHKLAERTPIHKVHRLRFVLTTAITLRTACAHLRKLKGVTNLVPGSRSIEVAYDLRFVSLQQIEAAIASAGLVFKGGLHALQRQFWQFIEHNELANLGSVSSSCCNRPPVRLC